MVWLWFASKRSSAVSVRSGGHTCSLVISLAFGTSRRVLLPLRSCFGALYASTVHFYSAINHTSWCLLAALTCWIPRSNAWRSANTRCCSPNSRADR